MIKIGLATWTDHPYLSEQHKPKITLPEYTDFFPIVEVDSPFYAIPKVEWVQKWVSDVPDDFQFIVKANSKMTKTPMQNQLELSDEELEKLFVRFKEAFQQMIDTGKLASFLFQFPPSFACNQTNIQYLRQIRQWMGKLPLSIEFRNSSWVGPEIGKDAADFLSSLKMTEVVVDEPHQLYNGVPFTPVITNRNFAYLRLHGQNEAAWAKGTRERYRYRYSKLELERIAKVAVELSQSADEVAIIFNNNTGKAAAKNAIQLQEILHLKGNQQAAMQLNLF